MRRIGAALSCAVFFLVTGCGSTLSTARRAYYDGRYLEVAEQLGDCENEVSRLSPDNQADYGLYRGLSLLKLGDDEEASRWLEFTAAIEAKLPGTLLPREKAELGRARALLAKNMLAKSTLAKGTSEQSSTPAPAVSLRAATSP